MALTTRERLLQGLQSGPHTAFELIELTGVNRNSAYAMLCKMHRCQQIHIVAWRPNVGAGWPEKVWSLGQGKDRPRPRPMTPAERYLRVKEFKKKSKPVVPIELKGTPWQGLIPQLRPVATMSGSHSHC